MFKHLQNVLHLVRDLITVKLLVAELRLSE